MDEIGDVAMQKNLAGLQPSISEAHRRVHDRLADGAGRSWNPRSQLTKKDISPYFWPNGTMPHSKEFDDLVTEGFASYRLRVSGLVESPQEFSLSDLKAMAKKEQITTQFVSKAGPASPNGAVFPCEIY